MLKNKKAIYILIPVNLLVWGFLAFKIYSALNETDAGLANAKTTTLKVHSLTDSVTYKLVMDYKDPFLKDVKPDRQLQNSQPVSNAQVQPKSTPPKPAPVIPKQLPEVKYLGLIKNNTSGLSTALVSVNGQSRLIKQNESVDGIVFKSFNKDSLVAKWGKERIVARK